MHLFHFELNQSKDLDTFIEYWSKLYSYSNESVYKNAISQKEFEKNHIQDLFVWKNGMKLSDLKQKSLESKILSKLDLINRLKINKEVDLVLFKNEFKSLTTVWKIFLLHIIAPKEFPIYDQHIHRSFLFIHQEEFTKISNTTINNIQKEEFYFERYLPFIRENNIKDLKKLDEAFFAFGQFLKTKNYKIFFSDLADL
jgi:hypothetical protein